jgi:hypothetical protein
VPIAEQLFNSTKSDLCFIIQDSEFKIKTTGKMPVFGLFVPLPHSKLHVFKY